MPDAVQGSLPIEAPPVAPKAPPKAAPRRFELPAEIEPEAKVAPKAPSAPAPDQNKAEEATAPAPEEKPDEATPEEVEKRRESRRFERRIDKLTRRAAEAQARADLAERQLAERSQAKPAAVDEAAPRLEQFDYDPEKYAAAREAYATKKAEKTFTENQQKAEATKQREKLVSSWEEKAEKASDKYEDFETVVGKLTPDNPFTQAIMEADAEVDQHQGHRRSE